LFTIYQKSDGQPLLIESKPSNISLDDFDTKSKIDHVINKHGGEEADYDIKFVEDVEVFTKMLTHEFIVVDGEIIFGDKKVFEEPPQPPSVDEKIESLQTENVTTMIALTELYEDNAQQDSQREQEAVTNMLALTEAYELILQQQKKIEQLEQALITGGLM
jgi:hypothetical protein